MVFTFGFYSSYTRTQFNGPTLYRFCYKKGSVPQGSPLVPHLALWKGTIWTPPASFLGLCLWVSDMHVLLLLDLLSLTHYLFTCLFGEWRLKFPFMPRSCTKHRQPSPLPVLLGDSMVWVKQSSVFALLLLCKHYAGQRRVADLLTFPF